MDKLNIPGNIYFTNKSDLTDFLYSLRENKILLFVTNANVRRLAMNSVISHLTEIAAVTWISNIPSNPTYIDIFKTMVSCKKKPFDRVVAIGGGSTIDLAKSFVGLYYLVDNANLNENMVLDSIKTKEYLNHRENIPILAIPTTAGTGSEVTKWATIWDLENRKKYSIESDQLQPKNAYIIPEFTLTMPKRLTLSTGLDALCQAVEAYWAKATNLMVKQLSLTAIKLIVEYLPKVLNEGNKYEYRQKVALGSLFSGLAFSNTKTTACHSISYPLTMLYGMEHGLACIISLPKVMEMNIPVIDEVEELFDALKIDSIYELQTWLDSISEGIASFKLSSYGINITDIDELVKLSFTLGRMDNNPVEIKPEDVRRILVEIM